jgi:hypothetical protein
MLSISENLYSATTEIHHTAQKHPFGKRLAAGNISVQEWADWLDIHALAYGALDPYLPQCLKRSHDIALDLLAVLPVKPNRSDSFVEFLGSLNGIGDLMGAAYTLVGANLRGGQVMKGRLESKGFVVNHTDFTPDEIQEGEGWLKAIRATPEIAEAAKKTFWALYQVMDEIEARAKAVQE